jgi:SagB-type dehydrogenase family enzyme
VRQSSFTVRVDQQAAIASRDDGASRVLSAAEADAIAASFSAGKTEFMYTADSAVARASLAEAREVLPRPTAAPRESPRRLAVPEIALAPHVRALDSAFGDVLASRRSQRRFAALGLDDLATVLVSAGRITSWTDADDGFQMTTRPVPSAGGRHPYELAVAASNVHGLPPGLWEFNPARCTITAEPAHDRLRAALDHVAAAAAIPGDAPATIFVVGQMRRTLSRYPAGSTLVWRDAGAVLATLHLAATAAGLASCIVGTAGVLLYDEQNLTGDLGALVVGRPLLPS